MLISTSAAVLASVSLIQLSAPDASAPLPMDPAIVSGKLDNGLHYMVRKNNNPPGRAVMWVHMHTGSLNETDRQRGIAHYLEHMAFNGSENFAPGTLVPFFQSLGMQFGRDQNAFTNFEQTTYQLSLPDVKPETLDKGLTFFADVVGRLSLLPKEIDEERGIIQEERRRGLSGRQRTGFYIIEHMAPGSLWGQRMTIGTEQTIATVNEQDFKDYYGKWYGASNATMMVVADADPQEVVKALTAKFSVLPKKPRPVWQDPGIKAYEKSFAVVASDPEVRSESLQIVRLEPARPPVTTEGLYRDELVGRLGTMCFNRRIDDKVSKGGTAYQDVNAGLSNEAGIMYTAELTARSANGKWKDALNESALELQRARAFGFTPREFEDACKQVLSGAERAVETEGTQPSQGFISRMNGDVTSGEPVMSAQQRLDLLKKTLPSIKVEEVSKRFAKEFDPTAVCFIVTLPSGPGVPSESELVELGTKALAQKPSQEAETARATQLMTELPKPGTVAEAAEHPASHVWNAWLSNNVRVHYKFNDTRKNEVSVGISLIGGELLENANNRAITQGAQVGFSRPATSKLASTDIREIMTGKKISVRGGGFAGMGGGRGGRGGGGGVGGDSISLNISGSPAELETGMQLAYLMLTDPKIEPAAFTQAQTRVKEMLAESTKNPMFMGMRLSMTAPYPETEPRTSIPTAEQIDKITVEAAQTWLNMLVKTSPIEVTIVGDIEKDKAMDLAAKYLGALPSRDRVSSKTLADLRKIERPKGPRSFEKVIDTPTPQAFVYSGFYGADQTNVPDVRALNMAARILSTRMIKEVREDAQLVYSIGASSRPGGTYPGFGVVSAGAPTDPAKVPALVAKLESMYAAFAKDGPTEDELVVAKKQMAKTFEEQMKEPGYWSGVLDQLDFRGANLDDTMGAPDAYQAMTAQAVKDTFAKYYSKDNSIVVVVKPAATPEAAPKKTEG